MRSLVRFLALAVFLAPAIAFAAPPKSGTWELAYSPSAASEQVLCLFKIEAKEGGALAAELVAGSPNMPGLEVMGATQQGDILRVQIKLSGNDYSFEGKV